MTGLFERFFGVRRRKDVTRPVSLTGTPWSESDKNRLLRLRAEFPGLTWRQFQQRFFPARSTGSVNRQWHTLSTQKPKMEVMELTAEAMVAVSDVVNEKRRSPSLERNTGRRSKIPRVSDSESGSDNGNEGYRKNDDSGESDPEAGDIDNDGVTRRFRYPLRSIKIKKVSECESKDGDNRVHTVEVGEDGQSSKPADSHPIANEDIPSTEVTSRIKPECLNFIQRRPSSTLQKPMVVVRVPASIHTHAVENSNSSPRPSSSETKATPDSARDNCTTIQSKAFQGKSSNQSTAIKYESLGSYKARSSSIPIYKAATAPHRSTRSISIPGSNGLSTGPNLHSQEYENPMETFTIRKQAIVAKEIRHPLPTSVSSDAPTVSPFARHRNSLSASGSVTKVNLSMLSPDSESPAAERNSPLLTAQAPDNRTNISQGTTAGPCPTPEPIAASITRQRAPQKPSPIASLSQKRIEATRAFSRVRESTIAKAGIAETPRKYSSPEAKPSPKLAVKPLLRPLFPARPPTIESRSAGPDLVQTTASVSKQQDAIPPMVRSPSIPNILTQIQRQASAEHTALQAQLGPLVSRANAARARFDKASELKAKLGRPDTFLASDLMELNSFLAQTSLNNRQG
ncbi:uncharacterized protein BDV14DRAFT_203722 [Aspergillus stella-maris]|uniref:uncharacterized protein n=1 Tax=Aspergillus stella-maris TaxID=1810926 RepID=UPI003CCCE125